MQRRRPLRRSGFRQHRPDTIGVTGRPAASRIEWQAIQSQVRSRAGWRCEACGRRGRLDVHYLTKRAQGGSDFDLDQLAVYWRCHEQTDGPVCARATARRGLGGWAISLSGHRENDYNPALISMPIAAILRLLQ